MIHSKTSGLPSPADKKTLKTQKTLERGGICHYHLLTPAAVYYCIIVQCTVLCTVHDNAGIHVNKPQLPSISHLAHWYRISPRRHIDWLELVPQSLRYLRCPVISVGARARKFLWTSTFTSSIPRSATSYNLPGTRRNFAASVVLQAKVKVHTAHFENISTSPQPAVFTSSESRSLLRRLDIFRGGLWSY